MPVLSSRRFIHQYNSDRALVPTALFRVYPLALVAGMFLFDTASLMLYIVPHYYGPG